MLGRLAMNRQGARLWLTLLVVFAFALQSYAVQTHIHSFASSGLSAALGGKSAPDHPKAPYSRDQACPLCQAVAHAGNFVMPGAAAVLAPTLSVQIVSLAIATPFGTQLQRPGWQSRAPPII